MHTEALLAHHTSNDSENLVTTAQLRALGYDARAVRQLVRDSGLWVVRRGFFSFAEPTWRTRLVAALRAIGGGAASHRSAARIHGLWSGDDLDVTVVYPSRAVAKGVSVHRSRDLDERDVDLVDGIRVTTVPRTLVDVGLVLPPSEVQRLVDHAIALGTLDPVQLMQLRWRVSEHGRTGVTSVDSALSGLPQLAHVVESGPELRLLRLLEQSHLPAPTPQFRVRVGRREYRIDLAYPRHRVGLEYDGAEFHSRAADVASDRRRQRELESRGWRIERFRWSDLVGDAAFKTISSIDAALRATDL